MNKKRKTSTSAKTVSIVLIIMSAIVVSSCTKETCPAYANLYYKADKRIVLYSSYGSRYIPSPLTDEQKVLKQRELIKSEPDKGDTQRDN